MQEMGRAGNTRRAEILLQSDKVDDKAALILHAQAFS